MILTDSGLEFDEAQLISDYHHFYEEVRQELESRWGKIAVLRTCRNLSDHLKGTVYVEFARGPTATWDAAEACHGRWFGGNQLNCSVVRLAGGWREAICGLSFIFVEIFDLKNYKFNFVYLELGKKQLVYIYIN